MRARGTGLEELRAAALDGQLRRRINWTSVGPRQPSPIDDLKNWTLK